MALLEQVLGGAAPAHLVVVRHALASPPWPLVRAMLNSSGPVLAITLLRPAPEIPGRVLDLSAAVPGYSERDVEAEIMQAITNLAPGTQVLLDAPDILAEDHPRAWRILRALVTATAKPGSRLILPAPSPFVDDLVAASLSPSLALLTPLPARVVQATIEAYLLTSPDERLFSLLESAAARGAADLPVLRDMEPPSPDAVVLVLLRKAAGGAKGIQRSIEGFQSRPVALEEMVDFRPAAVTKVTTHADLNLPFNLSLTESQREARGAVPLPYAHEGEGADLGMGMDWSDDEEDEEI